MEITVDVILPHCDFCEEEWLDATLTKRISEALEEYYRNLRCQDREAS